MAATTTNTFHAVAELAFRLADRIEDAFDTDAEPCEDCTGNGEPCDTCYGWGHITHDLRPLVFSIDEMHDTQEELAGER